MLTTEEKKRLSGKCEELALREEAPRTLDGSSWCRCGIGHVMQAAGFVPRSKDANYNLFGGKGTMSLGAYCDLAGELDGLVDGLISDATVREVQGERGALRFPLLALRDALLEAP